MLTKPIHAVALVALLLPATGYSELSIIDASQLPAGAEVSDSFDNVTLSTAVGSMEIFDTTVTVPLTLTSDLTTPVYTTGAYFSHFSGDIWSAGQCCGGNQVLRADFDRPVVDVAVTFSPDDTDTGVLQIYDWRGRLLGEEIFRASSPFTLSLETPNRPIAYALATFGDTGRIGVIAFRTPKGGPSEDALGSE